MAFGEKLQEVRKQSGMTQDIAGMDLVEEPKPLYPKGASGFGVRLINQFINEL